MNSANLPMELIIVTSTKEDGSMHLEGNRRMFMDKNGFDPDRLILCQQVHGNSVAYVGEGANSKQIKGVDALFTDNRRFYLGILHADCYPVAMWVEEKGLVKRFGIAHAGFEGIAHGEGFDKSSPRDMYGVAVSLAKSLRDFAPKREYDDLKILIGSGICQKHYEIKDDSTGLGRFSEHSDYRKFPFVSNGDGKMYLDLLAIIVGQLIKAGVPEKNITDAPTCDYLEKEEYFSYRRGDGENRNMAIIGIR